VSDRSSISEPDAPKVLMPASVCRRAVTRLLAPLDDAGVASARTAACDGVKPSRASAAAAPDWLLLRVSLPPPSSSSPPPLVVVRNTGAVARRASGALLPAAALPMARRDAGGRLSTTAGGEPAGRAAPGRGNDGSDPPRRGTRDGVTAAISRVF
jgi:hypothetical protein